MKTTLMTLLAGTALLSLIGTAQAGSGINNHNQIVASPKYNQVLNEQEPAAPTASVTRQMTCDACKDQVTTRTDMNARGANKPTVTTTTHLCSKCDTRLQATGQGKNIKTVPHHTCTAGKTASCCGTPS